jgi:hypothetical protein
MEPSAEISRHFCATVRINCIQTVTYDEILNRVPVQADDNDKNLADLKSAWDQGEVGFLHSSGFVECGISRGVQLPG